MMRETIFPFSSFSDGSSTFSIDLEDITKLSHKSLPLRMRRNFGMENSSLVHFFSLADSEFSQFLGEMSSQYLACCFTKLIRIFSTSIFAHFTESPLGFSWGGGIFKLRNSASSPETSPVLYHRLRIHRCATRDISCLTYTSYPRAFLASTHARFYKELDGETSNKRRF